MKMECSINSEKIQAMKNYKRALFVYNFILYSLTSLITFLFFSYPFMFPSIKHHLITLPNNIPLIFTAKSLFIVANLIVFILIGESKLQRSSQDNYVARSRGCLEISSQVPAEEKFGGEKHVNIKNVYDEEYNKEFRVCKTEVWDENGTGRKKKTIDRKEKTKGEKEDHLVHISIEELNKRVEAFIARVNKQRLLEANKVVDHCRG